MPSGKTIAARPQMYNGVNLASPGAVQLQPVPTGSGFKIADAINLAQQGQNSANAANNQRYNQGLGVLSQGYTGSQGMISDALKNTAYLGNKELQDVKRGEAQGYARVDQDAINKGLNNTTITGTQKTGVERQASEARLGIRDMVAKNQSAIQLQGAANMNQGANSISSFIAGRNDVGPSVGEYAGLVQGAAMMGGTNKSTATITKGSINDPINLGNEGGSKVQQPAGGGGALGTSGMTVSGGGGAVGGGMGSMQIGSGGGGGGGGGGSGSGQSVTGGGMSPTGGYITGGGTISSALSQGGSGGASGVMSNAGYAPGSISITPGQAGTGNALPVNPNAANPASPARNCNPNWSWSFPIGQPCPGA